MFAVIAVYSILLAIFAYLIWKLRRSGLFDPVDVSISGSPPVLNKAISIYYKHHIGPYNRLSTVFQEAKSLIPQDGELFAIYYDDPEELKEYLLQSAVGVIFGEEGNDYYPEEYKEKLTKWGYEQMVIPKIERAVVATQRFEGYFSLFTLLNYTYPKVLSFLKKHNLPVRVAVEVYSNRKVHVMIPLDHHDDFLVPQLMSIEEVEDELARKRGDSDVSTETSTETELDEEQETLIDAGDVDNGDTVEVIGAGDKKDE